MLPAIAAEAELLINGLPRPAAADDGPQTPAEASAARPRKHGIPNPIPAPLT